ncbi:MAG: hypothetical protein Q9190_007284, partial [Brigantiaea leucoxantha]
YDPSLEPSYDINSPTYDPTDADLDADADASPSDIEDAAAALHADDLSHDVVDFGKDASHSKAAAANKGAGAAAGAAAVGLREKKIPTEERSTTPYMTKYERARVLGVRAAQISQNAPVLVDLEGESDPLQIAIKELKEKKIPLVVRRHLPDGWYVF